jgi:hypothetical protein
MNQKYSSKNIHFLWGGGGGGALGQAVQFQKRDPNPRNCNMLDITKYFQKKNIF